MRRLWTLVPALVGLAGMATAAYGASSTDSKLPFRAIVPQVAVAELEPTPTPIPTPTPSPTPAPVYDGHVASLSLGSARVTSNAPLEELDTHWIGGREYFSDPTAPQYIATYPRFGKPGHGGGNTVFAAHVNYVYYGAGPFAYLHTAHVDDALYVTMDNGLVYTYTVKSVDIVHLDWIDMDQIVFPPLDEHTERVTLISCGGTFIPAAVGGEYTSRVILIAERWVP